MKNNDEDDYMSNVFVQEPEQHNSNLTKLMHVDRKRKLENKHKDFNAKARTTPKHIIEQKSREKGLTTALTNDNIGFKLMSKMGYKTGQGLGPQNKGRAEPIPITLKADRTGIGRESAIKDAQFHRQKLRAVAMEQRAKVEVVQRNKYQSLMKERFDNKQIEKDLYKSQKVCLHLDTDEHLTEPNKIFFWPEAVTTSAEDSVENEEGDLSPGEKLSLLTAHLRMKYLYCVWCGYSYENLHNLENECPGDTANAHDDDF